MSITINPAVQINAAGSFGITWSGLIQGTAYPDPATRFALASGWLNDSALPMWGGIAISENVPQSSNTLPLPQLGGAITRATAIAGTSAGNMTGFSVFDQAYGMVNTPNSPVPLGALNSQVMFYRLGSGARIIVAADPELISLAGGIVTPQVSWDFNAQVLAPYDAATASYAISTAVWDSGSGGEIVVVMTTPALNVGAVGDAVTISGATNSGTGGASAVNRQFFVSAFTDNSHFTLAAPAAAGVIGTIGGSPVVAAGVGALAVKVLRVEATNCMTVVYDPVTGFDTWNRNGSAAVIQI